MATQKLEPDVDPADLAAQLESPLHAARQCDEDWRLDDRIALALGRAGFRASPGTSRLDGEVSPARLEAGQPVLWRVEEGVT